MRKALGALAITGLLLLAAGCAPGYPQDEDHDLKTDGECIGCHFYEDGGSPPADHWDGSVVASSHDSCTVCHKPSID